MSCGVGRTICSVKRLKLACQLGPSESANCPTRLNSALSRADKGILRSENPSARPYRPAEISVSGNPARSISCKSRCSVRAEKPSSLASCVSVMVPLSSLLSRYKMRVNLCKVADLILVYYNLFSYKIPNIML